MEYIEKEKLTEAIQKLLDARERGKNCSKQSATEYAAFKMCLTIINKMDVVTVED